MNAAGSNQTRLTYNAATDSQPSWSPDGTKITFMSSRDDSVASCSSFGSNSEIYVMNADGSNQTRLTNNGAVDQYPAWSPDGSKIAFGSGRDGRLQIYVMNADGSGMTRLTMNNFNNNEPNWSPDGAKIAFGSDRGPAQIFIMNSDGSDQTGLPNNSASSGGPVWTP